MQGFSKVVGTTFRDDVDLSKLKVGDDLILVREKDNQYDPNAVAIYANFDDKAKQIGYVKRELAQDMAKLMDAGEVMVGEITQITGGHDGQNHGVNYKFW